MAEEIKMPQLSDTMDSGKIISWNVNEGDTVNRGDILAEVETDKANLEIECFVPGTVLKIVTGAGDTADVGEVIAYIGEEGETISANGSASSAASDKPEAEQESEASDNNPPARDEEPTQSTSSSSEATAVEPTSTKARATEAESRVKASPLAKKIAQQNNVQLDQIQGSGPQGRIIKKDVEALVASSTQGSPAQARPERSSTPPPAPGSGTLTPLSKMRATIASRMQKAVVEAPHFYTTCSIDMAAALEFRAQCKNDDSLSSISINHLIIKACGYALSKEPRVNCAMKEDQLFSPPQINIGIITAVEDGLMIPVVKDVDYLSLKDLAFEARAAIERARAGRPSSTDLSGGTFSISNMGMFDVESFTAIINPGQGAVLAVSSIMEQPVVKNGQITVGHLMKVTLSVDHRIIDGMMAGNFLKHFKAALESPALMLVG